MLEKTVEGYLRDEVKKQGGLALKFVSPGFTGVPDRLLLLPGGRIAFAETKAPSKTPRSRQKRVHAILTRLDFRVFVPDTKEKVDSMIQILMGGGAHEV